MSLKKILQLNFHWHPGVRSGGSPKRVHGQYWLLVSLFVFETVSVPTRPVAIAAFLVCAFKVGCLIRTVYTTNVCRLRVLGIAIDFSLMVTFGLLIVTGHCKQPCGLTYPKECRRINKFWRYNRAF